MALSSKRTAKGRLQRFIDGASSTLTSLPLIHTTSAFQFSDILEGDGLTPAFCRVFNERLIYLFYGRPAYRTGEFVSTNLEFNWPIVFLFDPNEMPIPKRIFPFDTGAFKKKLYKKFFSHNSVLPDFAFGSDIAIAKKLIDAFFGSNYSYYTGRSIINLDIPLKEFEAQGLYDLARQSPDPTRDDRSFTIEFQFDSDIPFKSACKAIVLPQLYASDSDIITTISRWEIENIRFYDVINLQGFDSITGQVFSIVKSISSELGMEII